MPKNENAQKNGPLFTWRFEKNKSHCTDSYDRPDLPSLIGCSWRVFRKSGPSLRQKAMIQTFSTNIIDQTPPNHHRTPSTILNHHDPYSKNYCPSLIIINCRPLATHHSLDQIFLHGPRGRQSTVPWAFYSAVPWPVRRGWFPESLVNV